ncbi:hypothetical protein [Corynebacterium auriscanis]|uniref:Uncharacterized protein n=1 Tax=Corynebacterium auriscanis TaxID=99807 RepID=A0A0A2DJT2_9CORY|nr:hypothetical protein [Corynebacterium auriscanis]KGM18184.1 hypothetical protein MA47_09955 [Corynebacterium auriscanis]WJY73283.1 hypothetical protein CAURIC_08350 [Corynebacterium auriscanis]
MRQPSPTIPLPGQSGSDSSQNQDAQGSSQNQKAQGSSQSQNAQGSSQIKDAFSTADGKPIELGTGLMIASIVAAVIGLAAALLPKLTSALR